MTGCAQKATLDRPGEIKFQVCGIENTSAITDRYRHIMANHMLYHVNDLNQAFVNVCGLLEQDGTFCASTMGSRNLFEMSGLICGFTKNDNYDALNNGITVTSKQYLEAAMQVANVDRETTIEPLYTLDNRGAKKSGGAISDPDFYGAMAGECRII